MLGKNLFHGILITLCLQFGLSSGSLSVMRQIPAFDLLASAIIIAIGYSVADILGDVLKTKFEQASEKGSIKIK